jgi:hypothetical protein
MNSEGECEIRTINFSRVFQTILMVLYTFLVTYLAVTGVNTHLKNK